MRDVFEPVAAEGDEATTGYAAAKRGNRNQVNKCGKAERERGPIGSVSPCSRSLLPNQGRHDANQAGYTADGR